MTPVDDPEILAQLNGSDKPPLRIDIAGGMKPVTDPAVLDQLNVSGTDRAQAAASGVNRGALVNLAGLPVASALNAWDLLKAGAGVGYHEISGKPVPEALTPSDRSQAIGSPEWISQNIEKLGAGQMINPNRPDDQASRLLHAGGQGVAAGLAMPQGLPQALTSAGIGATSLASGELAAENGAGPAGQILAASAIPSAAASIASRAQSAQAAATKAASQNAPMNETVRNAQDAGYGFPPSQTNPTLLNKVVGGVAGKAATEQSLAIKNQQLTNDLVRQGLELPADSPISTGVLAKVRSDAGQAYDAVKGFGPVRTTPDFVRAIIGLRNGYIQSTGGLPSLRVPAVEKLINEVSRPGFSSESAVELIKRLRADADTGFNRGGPQEVQTARVQKGVANALENLVGENLKAAGKPDLLDQFQSARQRIAQTYTVQDALNQSTGNVDARKLFSALSSGTPITGPMRTAAQAAGFAPKSMQEYTQTPPGISVLDATIAGGAGLAGASGGHSSLALGAAWPFLRMGARALATSGPYQRTFGRPSEYEPSALASMLIKGAAPQQGALTAPYVPASVASSSDAARRRMLVNLLTQQGS